MVINMVVMVMMGDSSGSDDGDLDLLRHQRKIKLSSIWFLCISLSQLFKNMHFLYSHLYLREPSETQGPSPQENACRQNFA